MTHSTTAKTPKYDSHVFSVYYPPQMCLRLIFNELTHHFMLTFPEIVFCCTVGDLALSEQRSLRERGFYRLLVQCWVCLPTRWQGKGNAHSFCPLSPGNTTVISTIQFSMSVRLLVSEYSWAPYVTQVVIIPHAKTCHVATLPWGPAVSSTMCHGNWSHARSGLNHHWSVLLPSNPGKSLSVPESTHVLNFKRLPVQHESLFCCN